jgi:shikimate dehydrogenase
VFEPAEVDNYAVLGNPISHSLSPIMHNAAFAAAGYHGVYIALKTENIGEAIAALKAMNFKGASITIPHKGDVMPYLDDLDDMAGKIKAVNTVINKNGRFFGCNTDYLGSVRALSERATIRGRQVVIVGAGGAARAIGFGVVAEGGQVTIVNRSKEAGERLAEDLKVEFVPLAEIKKLKSHILINTTSVGMTPDVDSMPVPEDVLNKNMVVMDIVYNPLKTRLLRKANEIGCVVIDGVSMLVYQGAAQFELWTGLKAPVERMRMAVLATLGARQSNKRKVR